MVIAKPSFRVPTSYTLRGARRHPYPRPQYRDDEVDGRLYQPHREDDILIQLILENDERRAEEEVPNIEEDIEEIPVLSLILLQLLLIILLFLRRALIMAFILRYVDEEE